MSYNFNPANMFSGGGLQGGIDATNTFQGGMNQIMQMLQPYMNFGNQIGGNYTNYANQGGQNFMNATNMMQNPGQFMQMLMSGYTQTPQATYQLKQAQNAANAMASAGGMTGSGPAQSAIANQSQQIVGADQQNYLNNMMNIWDKYLGNNQSLLGLGQGMLGMGEQGAISGAQNISDIDKYMAQAQMMADMSSQSGMDSFLGDAAGLFGGTSTGKEFGGWLDSL